MSVGVGVQLNQIIEHRDASGRLIIREVELESLEHPLYHKLRHRWCNKYRTAWSPNGFREGEYNLKNILFLIRF
jgi:hypothetical protein